MKRALKRIFRLPPLTTVLAAIPSFALLIWVLSTQDGGPLAYAVYLASAYALVISCTGALEIWREAKRLAGRNPLTQGLLRVPAIRRLAEDVRFRTQVSLYLSLFINLLYTAVKLASGLRYHSLWFGVLAVYYALLAAMRFLLLRSRQGEALSREEELRRYRLCGVMLLAMNQALAGMVIFMVHDDRGYDYPGPLIYGMAAYAFYAVIGAAVNLARYRKYHSPVLSAAKAVSLTAAMVSILSLETAMIARFGDRNDGAFRRTMTNATGGGVCLLVLGMAVVMICSGSRELKKLRKMGCKQNANHSETKRW